MRETEVCTASAILTNTKSKAQIYGTHIVELRQLRYFQAVADAGGFPRAADRLHISQPPLSRQMTALEDELGVRLFDRGPRGVRLTPAGQAFLDGVRGTLRGLDQARIKAQAAGRGEIGTLSVRSEEHTSELQ